MKARPIGTTAVTILLVTIPSTFSAVAEATPATLHLSAIVYDTHQSKGVFSSKERVFQGTTKVGEDYSRCTEATSNDVIYQVRKVVGPRNCPPDAG